MEFMAQKTFLFKRRDSESSYVTKWGNYSNSPGPLNPYPDGPIGVIVEGAYADILLVNGNPLENIEIMLDPNENLAVIMKDGKIYKNTL